MDPMSLPASFPAPLPYPDAARLLAPASACAYLHSGRRSVAGDLTALQAWNAAMARPLPGMALAGLILSINLLGDWLRDALNPKLR